MAVVSARTFESEIGLFLWQPRLMLTHHPNAFFSHALLRLISPILYLLTFFKTKYRSFRVELATSCINYLKCLVISEFDHQVFSVLF